MAEVLWWVLDTVGLLGYCLPLAKHALFILGEVGKQKGQQNEQEEN